MSDEASWSSIKIELFSILSILYFVEKKFYNFNLLNCDTVNFYETELLNFNLTDAKFILRTGTPFRCIPVHFEHCSTHF